MKRTPLFRHTPLRPGKPWKVWRRPEEDKVSGDDYAYVMLRDGGCIFAALPDHVCAGHRTLEHVPEKNKNALGKRAPSDRWHLVVACLDANINGYASAHRDFARAHIARVEPEQPNE